MVKSWKKTLAVTIVALCGSALTPVCTSTTSQLPEIGTAAGNVLSVGQEKIMGDFYIRELRASAPIIVDPLLNQYINNLGQRLVANAISVKTPFYFHLIANDELNAFAFFGGNVVLHSALFRYVDTESQLAAVMSHEISHVTQRHLARAMEDQQRNAPLAWVGLLGSVLLMMASPEAGMAGLHGTVAGMQQRVISFTQQNEQEADRLGMGVLQRSGFDPKAMPDFLQKLLDQIRYMTRPPEMLLTHPLPESRLSDARNRANQMQPVVVQSSADFYLAKARLLTMYAGKKQQLATSLLAEWDKGNVRERQAAQYGRAVQALEDKKYDVADQLLQPLMNQQPNNPWFVDLATDIDIGNGRFTQAIQRLRASQEINNNPVLQINLANVLQEAGNYADAIKILTRYTFDYPDDSVAWDILAKAYAALRQQDQSLAAQAELMALHGDLDGAIRALSGASNRVKAGSLQQSRYDARIDQLRRLRQQFSEFKR